MRELVVLCVTAFFLSACDNQTSSVQYSSTFNTDIILNFTDSDSYESAHELQKQHMMRALEASRHELFSKAYDFVTTSAVFSRSQEELRKRYHGMTAESIITYYCEKEFDREILNARDGVSEYKAKLSEIINDTELKRRDPFLYNYFIEQDKELLNHNEERLHNATLERREAGC